MALALPSDGTAPDVEVLHVDVLVRSGFPLTPEQQPLLRRGLWREKAKEREMERGKEKLLTFVCLPFFLLALATHTEVQVIHVELQGLTCPPYLRESTG